MRVLWATRYIDAAVERLCVEGHEIRDEDVVRLSPLKHCNLNARGRYSFTRPPARQPGRRRPAAPLCDPDAPELDEDETGAE